MDKFLDIFLNFQCLIIKVNSINEKETLLMTLLLSLHVSKFNSASENFLLAKKKSFFSNASNPLDIIYKDQLF